jgi:hypothetical protein
MEFVPCRDPRSSLVRRLHRVSSRGGELKRQAFFAEELSYIRADHAFMPDKIGILFFTAAAGNSAIQGAFLDFPICTRY